LSKADQVYNYVSNKVFYLSQSGSKQSANLAKLRRGLGKTPGASPEIWEVTLADLPGDLAGYDGDPSYAEWAIHVALTLFAAHQQGKAETVNASGVLFGGAVSQLIDPDRSNEDGIKRRFDAALTSDGLNEFAHHARGLVQLMRARDVKMDYPLFARNIYDYQFVESKDRVRLRWGESYYRIDSQSETDQEGAQNE